MPDGITTIVVFGASGDLACKKLMPALFQLYSLGRLPGEARILGFALQHFTEEEFRDYLWNVVKESAHPEIQKADWDSFASRVHYLAGDIGKAEDVARAKDHLEAMESGRAPANRMFYLSLAPQLFQVTVDNLCSVKLAAGDAGWRRIVFEKPFGVDLASAEALNRRIHTVFKESQVFRIDHYLGKETVQNILVFRFANAIFEPLWNRNYVDAVIITVAEQIPVGGRAYYDGSGVVRDMVQNHLLQLLSLVAMEPPASADAESQRDKKVEVLKATRHWSEGQATRNAVRGQYRGYLNEPGVAPGSKTPTYAALRLYVDNWRWQGVPFYLRTGKSMAQKVTEIVIRFRSPPHLIFADVKAGELTTNTLGLCIQPDEGVHLRFEVKVPGQQRGKISLRPVDMKFHYQSESDIGPQPDAYVRLIEDALHGETSLFIRNDYIEEAWRLVDPLIRGWDRDPLDAPLQVYEPGSWGPPAADELIAGDGGWARGCVD